MHSYLIVGSGSNVENKISEITIKPKSFSVKKIEDARELTKSIRFTQSGDEYIIIRNIDEATPEALNCLLKTIEEPTAGINFILTAKSQSLVLPTILSRCQIINMGIDQDFSPKNDVLKFLKENLEEKMKIVNTLKNRDDAKEFLESSILLMKRKLESGKNSRKLTKVLRMTIDILSKINSNANTYIQLTTLAINITEETTD